MTNEEQELLIDYMVDAGELGPDGDLKAEFLDWYKVRGQTVSGEVHYKAALDAARVRKRAFTALWTMSPPGRGLNPGTRPQNRSLCVEIWWQRSLLNPKAASVQRVSRDSPDQTDFPEHGTLGDKSNYKVVPRTRH